MPAGSSRVIVIGGQNVTVFDTPSAQSFRLIHDGSKVLRLFQASGVTSTKNQLFYGTASACLAEASSKGLNGIKPFVGDLLKKQVDAAKINSRVRDRFYAHVLAELADSASALSNINTAIVTVKARLDA